jgi:hypothetical protein
LIGKLVHRRSKNLTGVGPVSNHGLCVCTISSPKRLGE